MVKSKSKSQSYKYKSFIDLKYKPKATDLLMQYKITPAKGWRFPDVASMVAGESSVGTWTEVKTMNPRIGKMLAPKVYYMDARSKSAQLLAVLSLSAASTS